jgi:hypothetical protein
MSVGRLFAMDFSPDSDSPFLLAAGGDKGMIAVWESDELAILHEYFSPRLPQSVHREDEKVSPSFAKKMNAKVPQTEEEGDKTSGMDVITAESVDLSRLMMTNNEMDVLYRNRSKKGKKKVKEVKQNDSKIRVTSVISEAVDMGNLNLYSHEGEEHDGWINTGSNDTSQFKKDANSISRKKKKKKGQLSKVK